MGSQGGALSASPSRWFGSVTACSFWSHKKACLDKRVQLDEESWPDATSDLYANISNLIFNLFFFPMDQQILIKDDGI